MTRDQLAFYENNIAALNGAIRRAEILERLFDNDPDIQRTIREIKRSTVTVKSQLILAMQKEKES